MQQTINLTFPKSWSELTDKQLLFLFTLLADGYPATDIKVKCLLKWTGTKVIGCIEGTPELLTVIAADTSMHCNFSNIIVCHALMNAVPSLDLVLTPNGFGVVNAVRSQIADVLRDKPTNHRPMTDCVNTIRRYPDSFPEWHTSATAELYTPKVFKNKKKSGSYWWQITVFTVV